MKKHLLNGKLMEMKLKIGWTAKDFGVYLDCSEEEFLKIIKEVFSASAAKGMLNRLEQNKKRQNKGLRTPKGTKKGKEKHRGSEVIDNLVESVLNKPREEKNVKEEEGEIKTEELPESVEETTVTVDELIAELNRKEETLRQGICQDETLKMQLISKRKKLNLELTEQRKVLIDLRTMIETANTKVLEVCSEINHIDSKIPEVNERISDAYDTIEGIQKEISDLKKVTIFIYESGEIEIEGGVKFEETETWEKFFRKLSLEESLEDLPIKHIKLLAKVLAFSETLENAYEVTFESDVLQQIFESFPK